MKKGATVGVLYGFSEGPHIAQALRIALEREGFVITQDLTLADILIAHSGGCFCIPRTVQARLIVLIGLPCWPGKHLSTALGQKILADYASYRAEQADRRWYLKSLWNGMYFWRMLHNIQMLRGMRRGLTIHPSAYNVLIRNRHDTGCVPYLNQLPHIAHGCYVSLPGGHDDCWFHPERYAASIKAYYGQALLA